MKFSTLFLQTKNEHLTKDIGAIPFFLNKEHGYETEIITYKNQENYSNHDKIMPNLTLNFIDRSFFGEIYDGARFLIKNASSIDILNLYHLSIKSFIWAYIYKTINKNGKLYLKTDASYSSVDKLKKCILKRIIIKKLFNYSDIVSVESAKILKEIDSTISHNYVLIPNGFFDDGKKVYCPKKEKIFLFVGRVDAPEKNVDFLIDAFLKSNVDKSWILKLVGPCSKEYQAKVNKRIQNAVNNNIRHVEFSGAIYDRYDLDCLYEKAAVLVLPSKYESYGIVLVEALRKGCYLIASENIPPLQEITCNYKFGERVDVQNVNSLVQALEKAAVERYTDEQRILEQVKYAKKNYSWKRIIYTLNLLIKNSFQK